MKPKPTKKQNKVRLVLMAEPDQITRLAKITEKTGATQSELVRRAINLFLSQEEK
jgi:hypothetical protein